MQRAASTITNGATTARKAQGAAERSLQESLILVVDTETTGIDVHQDRVVELGAAYFRGGVRREVHRARINPGCPIPVEASQIHGIYDKDVCDKPTFVQVAPRFLSHVDGSALRGEAPLLAGYNATSFDIPLLNAELLRAGVPGHIDPAQVLDLMFFVRWHHRDLRSRSLESVCQHYRIPLLRAHSALSDATATGHLMLKLIEAGLIPHSITLALHEQARLQDALAEERSRWSYWLYRDRRDSRLRLGAGRHCGSLLDDIEGDYLRYLLDKIPDLPDEVRFQFQDRVRAKGTAGELTARLQVPAVA